MLNIGMREQMLDKPERGQVKPLQVIKKKGEGVFVLGEHTEEPREYGLKPILRFLGAQLGNRRLFPDNQFKLGDQVEKELTVGPHRFLDRCPPAGYLLFALAQKLADQVLERLGQ